MKVCVWVVEWVREREHVYVWKSKKVCVRGSEKMCERASESV